MTKQTFSTDGDKPTFEQIAQRAYEIWERAGRPEGCSAEHWFQAESELASGTVAFASPSPSPNPPARARTPRQTAATAPRSRLASARN